MCGADVARGQRRRRRRRVAHPLEVLVQARRDLECRVGRCPRRINLTLVCQCNTEAHTADRFEELVVIRFALGDHGPESRNGTVDIAFHQLRKREAQTTHPRVGPVTNRVGEIASFFAGRAGRDRVATIDPGVGLPGEDLAQAPSIVQSPGENDRLREVRSRPPRRCIWRPR